MKGLTLKHIVPPLAKKDINTKEDVKENCEHRNVSDEEFKEVKIEDRIIETIADVEADKEKKLTQLLVKFLVRITLKEYYEKESNKISEI